MKVVIIKRPWSSFVSGDIAGFEDALADRLIAGNIAELQGTAETAAEQTAPPPGDPPLADPNAAVKAKK